MSIKRLLVIYALVTFLLWFIVSGDYSWNVFTSMMVIILCIVPFWIAFLSYKKSKLKKYMKVVLNILTVLALIFPPSILGYGLSIREYHQIDIKEQKQLQSKVAELIKYKNSRPDEKVVLDFNAITDFQWDKMYIMSSYHSGNDANKRLGFRWSNQSDHLIITTDSSNLLVFVKGPRVVQVLEYVGYIKTNGEKYSTPNNSKFEILKKEYNVNSLAYQ